MALQLDHIFVCVDPGAPEAAALIDAGLVEGPANVHPGQGTANRRFFFERGYLELIWVQDEGEARSQATARTRLWQRWNGRAGAANPFGICFASEAGVQAAPFPFWRYQPAYLPRDVSILFADGGSLQESELFALDWPQQARAMSSDVLDHRLPIKALRAVSIGLGAGQQPSPVLAQALSSGVLGLHRSARPELVLNFSAARALQLDLPALGIRLIGQPEDVD